MRLLLFLLLLPTALRAQTVLDYPLAMPAFGAYPVQTRNYGFIPALATSGIDVLWDLSATAYSVVGSTADSILPPAATPYSGDYPGATHAVRLVDQFGYYRITPQRIEDLGYRISAGSPSFVYSDAAEVVRFPAAVGDTWMDATLSGSTAATLTVTVLAAGELRLADASIPDAVLIRRQTVTGSSTATSTTWFRGSDALRPLGNLLANGTVIVRAPIGLTTRVEAAPDAPHVAAFPSPATDVLQVNADAALLRLAVMDTQGRTIEELPVHGARTEIAVAHLPCGAYLLRVVTSQGAACVRFVRD
jgi:hypothetical protein